ncbi:MAG: heme exporter protein CcmB [Actinomycetota bacterium]|nr:heme exporter protein CcmB [Actinomycetota bacterium]
MSFWSQAIEIARVDLAVERRLGDTLRIVTPFAVIALLVFPLALGVRLSVIREIGPAVFWALGILFGMQIALRQSAADSPERRDIYALMGLDPAARFAGRAMSGGVLMVAFLLILFVAMVVLYGPSLPPGSTWVVVVSAVLFAIGLTELATLAGEITAGLSNRNSLASLIVAPLALPLVIGASQALEALVRDVGILPWILLLLATDLALAVAGIGLARPIEEATR